MKLREQIWKADVARPIMMPAGFLRVRASEPRFSGAAEALEDQARALLYVLACGEITSRVFRTFFWLARSSSPLPEIRPS